MQTKFQVNDKVFWLGGWDEHEPDVMNISYVISDAAARKYYCGYTQNDEGKRVGRASVETIRQTSFSEYGCEPVFLVDDLDSAEHAGWMPENSLYLYTDAAKVLYGRKDR